MNQLFLVSLGCSLFSRLQKSFTLTVFLSEKLLSFLLYLLFCKYLDFVFRCVCFHICIIQFSRYKSRLPPLPEAFAYSTSKVSHARISYRSLSLTGNAHGNFALQITRFRSFFAQNVLVGLGGLEPPTSRLSGVRSNHLSYKPLQSS